MVSLIEKNLDVLKQLCRQYRVRRLELIGSALNDEKFEAERSDIDFLVEFDSLQHGEHADAYFGLLESLENLLGRHIDLVMIKAVKNRYFLESVNKNHQVLYAA
ncbi:MAG: nucleotidyltransferase domain-containing protein [Planctomycetaceae bacterium]|nr:nucleotidyltransferase domain-containing protein [Planctomycetaceae bacterium]